MQDKHMVYMRQAIELSRQGMDSNTGGPFGAVIVKDDQVVSTGNNAVTSTNDPTAHAEVAAIRNACQKLSTYDLSDCTLYASCEPCPMCLGAIYWSRIRTVYYANTREDAAGIGFDDSYIYEELSKSMSERTITFTRLAQDEARQVFHAWSTKSDKTLY